ncbi:MAG: cation:proton antiporter [Actinobacteria bacterium]|nr:cation:proton antiporter [Actinomycetota bacterium]MCG2819350.1 cation:proton antiporter [Actinomycetes bacterium]MBU4178856.1 cation:proton antiporter [Actinomycetota bacterium]MBU4218867.1 cation:proton antiporter [Actinomycetota bacterium]MBU4358878.1 cation:proton antiporter [Actinomycetota bacterium]
MLQEVIPKDPNFIAMAIGAALLLGWIAGLACRKIKIPMVVGWLIVGIIFGKSLFAVFNDTNLEGLVIFTYLALAVIGFDIGGEMAFRKIRALGKSILWISLLETLGASISVTIAVYLYTRKLYVALVFGALAAATAPAATVDVLREYQASGPLTTTTFAVVGIDDAYAVIIYSFSIFFAKMLLTQKDVKAVEIFFKPTLEILGSMALGVAVGALFLFMIRNYTARRGLLVMTWGVIVFVTGLANLLGLSLILANMALGMTIVNSPKWKRDDLFEIMRGTTQPVFVIFFVLVGAQLDAAKLASLGVIGLLYIVFRSGGKMSGAYLGGVVSQSPEPVRKYLGLCLMSQAGVAIGLATQTMITLGRGGFGPAGVELGTMAISVIAATSLVFQLVGPPLTRYAVFKSGEANV